MKKYDSYKDSGIEWIGEIPSHWGVTKIKNIASIFGRIGFRGYTVQDIVEKDNGAISLSPSNLIEQKLDLSKGTYISWDKYHESPEIQIHNGDVILVKTASVGKVGYIEGLTEPATLNPQLIVFKNTKIDNKYLYYLLVSRLIQTQIQSDLVGGVVPTLSQSIIKNYYIPQNSVNEQTAIANYLDHKTSQIDHLIAKKEQFIKLLEEERVAVINQAVTKGLNPNVPMKDSGVEWLGEIPEHWEVKKLKYLLKENKDALKTGPFGSHIKNSDYITNGEYKVYTQRNVLDNEYENGCESITVEKFSELKGFSIFEGDILITTRGSIGRCSVFPEGLPLGILHPCLIRVQINEKLSLKNWIVNYINNTSLFYNNVKYNSNSTIIDVIYGYTLKEIFFPVPTINEQIEILNYLELKTGEIEILISKSKQEIELLKEYKTALISEVVTGKVDVSTSSTQV